MNPKSYVMATASSDYTVRFSYPFRKSKSIHDDDLIRAVHHHGGWDLQQEHLAALHTEFGSHDHRDGINTGVLDYEKMDKMVQFVSKNPPPSGSGFNFDFWKNNIISRRSDENNGSMNYEAMPSAKLLALQVLYAMDQGFRSKRCSLHEICDAHDIGCTEIKRLYDDAMQRKVIREDNMKRVSVDSNGESALHRAIKDSDTEKIRNLVVSGEAVDLKSAVGLSPPRLAEKLGVNCVLLSLRARMKRASLEQARVKPHKIDFETSHIRTSPASPSPRPPGPNVPRPPPGRPANSRITSPESSVRPWWLEAAAVREGIEK